MRRRSFMKELSGGIKQGRALSSVMAPKAPCLSGLLCAASLSFITGHDRLHQLILTEQETIIPLSVSLLPSSVRHNSRVHVVSHCRTRAGISVRFRFTPNKMIAYCGAPAGARGEAPIRRHKQARVLIPVAGKKKKKLCQRTQSVTFTGGKPIRQSAERWLPIKRNHHPLWPWNMSLKFGRLLFWEKDSCTQLGFINYKGPKCNPFFLTTWNRLCT